MTIDADTVLKLVERFGLPTFYFLVLAYLGWLFIKGPAATLAKAGAEYLQSATESLNKTHVEHVEIKAHVSTESAAIKALVVTESAATRERVSPKAESTPASAPVCPHCAAR